MGLTSSQGRLLMLTSRLSDIQLDMMLISQRQQQLALRSEKAAKEYQEKMNNKKLVMKVNNPDEKTGYTREDLNYADMTSMGYLVTDALNRIYLTKKDGEWVVPEADKLYISENSAAEQDTFESSSNSSDNGKNENDEILSKLFYEDTENADTDSSIFSSDDNEISLELPSENNETPAAAGSSDAQNQQAEVSASNGSSSSASKIFDGSVYEKDGKNYIMLKGKEYEVIDGTEILTDTAKLQNNIMNSVLYVMNTVSDEPGGITLNQLQADTKITWEDDTSDDAEAESKYQYETARISAQDNLLDMELKQLETQHNAIIKEIESVEKVIDNNIERTFKPFSS